MTRKIRQIISALHYVRFSKWEYDRTSPDISQFPVFNISADVLPEIDNVKREVDIFKFLQNMTDHRIA